MSTARHLGAALALLRRDGLLLLHDGRLPSLTALMAGGPVRGSWWAHPQGSAIFAVGEALAEHTDVAALKLLAGKVTFVERALWPALLAVSRAGEPWQTDGLGADAQRLLAGVERHGTLRLDQPRPGLALTAREAATATKMLEARLLCRVIQVHTARGRHARALESWAQWQNAQRVADPLPTPADGRHALEAAAVRMAGSLPPPRLSWQDANRRRRGRSAFDTGAARPPAL